MEGIYDIHTHILPMVDDGAASIREALAIIREESEQGVGAIMLTPHFREKIFETEVEVICQRYEELLDAASELYPDMDLRLGCELHALSDMKGILEDRNYTSLDNSKYILLEFSGMDPAEYIRQKTKEVLKLGYCPILAHIERYPALTNNLILIEMLRELGAAMQINADSVLGEGSSQEKRFCHKLLKRGIVDFVASDVHNMTTRRSNIGRAADMIEKRYGREYAERLFIQNPRHLFAKDEDELCKFNIKIEKS